MADCGMIASARRPLNIALLGSHLAGWTGGNDFLRLCAGGLWQKRDSSSIRFSVLLPEDYLLQSIRQRLSPLKQAARQLTRLQWPRLSYQPKIRLRQVVDSVDSFGGEIRTVTYRDPRGSYQNLARVLTEHHFDVMFPVQVYRDPFPIPWVGYIPDLQHKHHPEFFTAEDCALRDRHFVRLLSNARAIIVNSVDTKNDIEQAYPGHDCAIFNLPFAPILNPAWLSVNSKDVSARYGLPHRYFLISNQFWVHKSHGTAFEALAKLSPEHADVALVCTGNTSDFRHPQYFQSLKERIDALHLQNRIRILGLIPKSDQIQIMRGAVAVVQPTLFEGGPGGGSVYDAVATGTPVILSDIAINREVDDAGARIQFFEKENAEDLAEQMELALRFGGSTPSATELQANSDRRAGLLGERLIEACDFVCDRSTR
jgi:glycosyltransferase involved in cell wall biosynthesis